MKPIKSQNTDQHTIFSILFFIASCGFAAADQIAEYMSDKTSEAEIEKHLRYLIERRLVAEAPLEASKTNKKTILYVTSAGSEKLRKIDGTAARCAAFTGKPDAEQLTNFEHHLRMAECLLALARKCEIQLVISKNLLGSRKRASVSILLEKLSAQEIAECDFIVIGKLKKTNERVTIPCRIAVNQTADALAKSCPRMFWFTTSDSQLQKLERIVRRSEKIPVPLSIERWSELDYLCGQWTALARMRFPAKKLNNLDRKVLEHFEKTQLTLCTEDLAVVFEDLNEDEEKLKHRLYRSLQKLRAYEYLDFKIGKIRPGYGYGRGAQYYFLTGNAEVFRGKTFQRHLVLGYFYQREIATGGEFVKFYPLDSVLLMRRDGEIKIFVSDYADCELISKVDLTAKLFTEFSRNKKYPVRLVAVDYYRYDRLVNKLGKLPVINMTENFDKYFAY